MTAPARATSAGQIIAIFPELLGVGGVQEAGRMTARALFDIAKARGYSTEFLSLNDAPGLHELNAAPMIDGVTDIALTGFGRAKARFTLSAMRRGRAAFRELAPQLQARPHWR